MAGQHGGSRTTTAETTRTRRPTGRARQDTGADVATTTGGQLLQDRYVVERALGSGGMATVYRAFDRLLERTVAVKVLHPHVCREPRFVQQFLDMELRIARLFHPRLVTIFDAGAEGDDCFIVMEYVAGGTLRELLNRARVLPVADAIRIVSQVAEAVQALHDEGIIHGDIKPDNVLLDDERNVKLADFGIAHVATTTGAVSPDALAGTAPYLAPEQLEQGRVGPRSDVYALGLVAYELVTGRRPFEGDNWVTVATQRLARDPAPPSAVRPGLPAELDSVILRCLARNPHQRFATAEDLWQALQRVPLIAPRPRDWWTGESERGADPAPAGTTVVGPTEPEATPGRPERRWSLPTRAAAGARRMRDRARGRFGLLAAAAVVGLLLLALVLQPLLDPPRPVQVPALAGQTTDAARAVARESNLRLRTSHERSEAVPKGMIVRQSPSAGATVMSDQSVEIVVSDGPPLARVPDLYHRRLDDARNDLASAGLTLGAVEEREVTGHPWGTIVRQSARAGRELERGGTVDVTVGVPPWTSAPKLVDRAIGDAEAELEKRGLRLLQVRVEPLAGTRAGTVIAQEPAADVRLRQGDGVTVTVALPPSAVTQQTGP